MLANKWFAEFLTPHLVQLTTLTGVVYSGRSRYQAVDILDTGSFGRCLVLDGKIQSSEADEFVYHEALVHPVMVAHPNPQEVFVAGGGEGATAREVLRHSTVSRLVMVDIDGEVVGLCRRYLPHHQGAFEDPRLRLHIADARAFLQETRDRFDIIVLDLADPIEGGPAYLLYTQEFYQMARERLRPGGMLVTQSGPAGVLTFTEVFTAIHRTLRQVFPIVVPYAVAVPSFGGVWGFNIASLGPDPRTLTPEEVDRRLAERVRGALRLYDGTAHIGLFSLPRFIREGLEKEERVIRDDQPLFIF